MKTIEVLKGSVPEGERPAIEVHTWLSHSDKNVTIADVRLRETANTDSAEIPNVRIKLLRRRTKMSHEAAIEFAKLEAKSRGLKRIYDTTVER